MTCSDRVPRRFVALFVSSGTPISRNTRWIVRVEAQMVGTLSHTCVPVAPQRCSKPTKDGEPSTRRLRVGTASANGSDTLTGFDSGLNRLPLLAPAPSVNVATSLGTEKPLAGSRC